MTLHAAQYKIRIFAFFFFFFAFHQVIQKVFSFLIY